MAVISSDTRPNSTPVRAADQRAGKQVTFELVLPSPQRRARLPLRVFIHPHDTTESIISTTKNFYGLYNPSGGVSFEDKDGNTIIAAYDNFHHLMTVYVRSMLRPDEPEEDEGTAADQGSALKRPRLDQQHTNHPLSGPAPFSRRKVAKFNSSELPLFVPSQVPLNTSASSTTSPNRNNNITTTGIHTFVHALPSPRSGGSSHVSCPSYPAQSRSSSGGGFVTLATPDPSLGHGSTISDEDVALQLMRLGDLSGTIPPARRIADHHRDRSPCRAKGDHDHDPPSDLESMLAHDDGYRSADSAGYTGESDTGSESGTESEPSSNGNHNHKFESSHGRPFLRQIAAKSGPTTASTSASAQIFTLPEPSSTLYNAAAYTPPPSTIINNTCSVGSTTSSLPSVKPLSFRLPLQIPNLVSPPAEHHAHYSPPAAPRPIAAVSTHPPIISTASSTPPPHDDDEDLSTKPRCQRCRKSKKGCDRQRPCMRCRDAGIGIDGCVSEEEGNGRKGRYGRFMGVGVKKAAQEAATTVVTVVTPVSDGKKRKR